MHRSCVPSAGSRHSVSIRLPNSAVRDLAARSKAFHGFNSSASSEASVPAFKDSFRRIHYDGKQSRLTFTKNSILLFERFSSGPRGVMPAISSLKEGSPHEKKVKPEKMENETTPPTTDAWTMYIYSLKSPVSK